MPWIYWAHKICEIAQNVENHLAEKRKRENQKERRFMVQCIIDYYSMKKTADFINRMPFVVLFPVILARVLRKSNQRIDGSDVYKIEIKKAYKVQCVRCSFNLCANECFLFWKKTDWNKISHRIRRKVINFCEKGVCWRLAGAQCAVWLWKLENSIWLPAIRSVLAYATLLLKNIPSWQSSRDVALPVVTKKGAHAK